MASGATQADSRSSLKCWPFVAWVPESPPPLPEDSGWLTPRFLVSPLHASCLYCARALGTWSCNPGSGRYCPCSQVASDPGDRDRPRYPQYMPRGRDAGSVGAQRRPSSAVQWPYSVVLTSPAATFFQSRKKWATSISICDISHFFSTLSFATYSSSHVSDAQEPPGRWPPYWTVQL